MTTPLTQVSFRTTVALLSVTALALGGQGCGGSNGSGTNAGKYSGEKQQVAAVVDRFAAASRAGAAREICEQIFSTELADRAAGTSGTCEEKVRTGVVSKDARYMVEEIEVQGDIAAAKVTEQDGTRSLLRFEHQGNGWRISRIRTP